MPSASAQDAHRGDVWLFAESGGLAKSNGSLCEILTQAVQSPRTPTRTRHGRSHTLIASAATVPATTSATVPATTSATVPATTSATVPATTSATVPATTSATVPATVSTYCDGIGVLRRYRRTATASAYCDGIDVLRRHRRTATVSAYCDGIGGLLRPRARSA